MPLEYIDHLRPRDFFRETSSGYSPDLSYAMTNDHGGLTLPKLDDQGYTAVLNIPGSLTVGTGVTIKVLLTDDGTSAADLGKVVRLGITPKRLVSGADTLDLDTAAATETAANVTLDATTGEVVVATVTIANAALDSTVVDNMFGLRVRRIGGNAADTCNGRVVLLSVVVSNT
jgi:hypothetical protein